MTARIAIASIQDGVRLRRADAATVKALAASMSELGLLNPITVQAGEIVRAGSPEPGYRLVAGKNRLDAARMLGWTEIEANVVDLPDIDRQMAEIDENLCRAELSAAERADWTAKRKRLYEFKHPETKRGAAQAAGMNAALGRGRKVCGDDDTFTAETAARSGRSRRAVELDAQRGERIVPEVMEQVKADPELARKGTVLDALARTPPEQQPAKLSEIASARSKPRPAAIERTSPEEAEDAAIAGVLAKVNKWPEAWRTRLIEALLDREAPVFDR